MAPDEKPKVIPMRVNVAGFTGEPLSLMAIYNPATQRLAIGNATKYDGAARAGFLCITTQNHDSHYDALFLRDEFQDAINAYFDIDTAGLLDFHDEVARFRPQNIIDLDKIDENGAKHKIDPTAQNGHVAVLVACLFAYRQRGAVAAAEMFADLMSMTI